MRVPEVTDQPADQIDISVGSNAPFMVTVTGSLLTYLWQKDEADISPDSTKYSGINTNHLIVMNVDESDNGEYRCMVTNDAGTTTSNEATLQVCKCLLYSHGLNFHPNHAIIVYSSSHYRCYDC